jgi:MFS family permease
VRRPGHREQARASQALPTEIWVLVAASFVIALGFGLVAPALPVFARSFDVGITAVSAVISAFSLLRLLFAPAAGRLVQRLGEQPVYLVGLLVVAASTGATGLAQSYWQLLVFRALGGIGSTMFTVSAVALLVRIAPPAVRGRVTGTYASSFLLGSILGPVLGALLVGFGLRVPFVIYTVALLVAAAVVWTQLRGSTLAARVTDDDRPQLGFREAAAHPAYRAALASAFANGWAVFGVRVSLVPLFVVASLGASASLGGVALAVFAVGNVALLALSGRASDRRGRRPLVLAGLVVLGLATALLGLSGAVWVLLLLCALAGVGEGLLNAPQQATVADVVGSDRRGGPALAGYQMAQDLGGIIGPLAAGALADHLSYEVAFGVTGLVVLAPLALWLRAPETLPARAQPTGPTPIPRPTR